MHINDRIGAEVSIKFKLELSQLSSACAFLQLISLSRGQAKQLVTRR